MTAAGKRALSAAALVIAIITTSTGVGSATVPRVDNTAFCASWKKAKDAFASDAPPTTQASLFREAATLAPTKILRKDLRKIAKYVAGASELSERGFKKLAGVVGTATSFLCDGELPE